MSRNTSPFWKQLVGAGIGVFVALGVYSAYSLVVPYTPGVFTHMQAYFLHDFVGQSTLPNSPRPSRHFIRNLADAQNRVMTDLSVEARQIARRRIAGQTTEDPAASQSERVTVTFEDPESPESRDTIDAREREFGVAEEDPAALLQRSSWEADNISSSSSEDVESTSLPLSDTHDLPSSGLTLWLGVLGALGGGALFHRRRLRAVFLVLHEKT